ncbi:hypothetical protein MWU52_04665 [Jannaschia sp. S6380]|uniref:AbaSI family restriction endonuclease n=1 Tax=Jannaschia sp. S6380 TaxID=2926408 RepID=UPI001FF0FAD0|nr:hypothetical protein [Jannaschia sp. S6380]MCK0166837.1 hypothetical protein [Jannaschia sp. S6380]
MNKDRHLLNMLTKVKHKQYEHFVVSRIIHNLCSTDIKLVSQQLVRRPSGRALLDLYFPQINVSLEVDEPQHEGENHKRLDDLRSRDIVEETNLIETRIRVLGSDGRLISLAELARQTDNFLSFILSKVEEERKQGRWKSWDVDNELTSKPHLERGYIDAREDVLLRKHTDAIELFGVSLKAHMRSGWTPPKETGLAMVWFPRLYQNGEWDNSLSSDGSMIVEKRLGSNAQYQSGKDGNWKDHRRAVFARREEPLIGTLYRFVGVFKFDVEASRREGGAVYYKVADRIDLR